MARFDLTDFEWAVPQPKRHLLAVQAFGAEQHHPAAMSAKPLLIRR